jgi:L,D-peptidoglycan transpeptidase YkuD (ErfK/YbiS/YcfS/YnhG family)
LWRADGIYDLIVELGYNDDPPLAGRGSAIFMHIAREGYLPTEGCVALAETDLRELLKRLGGGSVIEIRD